MPLLKLHSAQAVAASIAKGWKLNRTSFPVDDAETYEYLLEHHDPFAVPPTPEEIAKVKQAFVVDDALEVRDRGVVVAPGIQYGSELSVSDGDKVVVVGKQSAALYSVSPALGLNLKNPFRPLIIRKARKSDIELGSTLWVFNKTGDL